MIEYVLLRFFCKCNIKKKYVVKTEEYEQQKSRTMLEYNQQPS